MLWEQVPRVFEAGGRTQVVVSTLRVSPPPLACRIVSIADPERRARRSGQVNEPGRRLGEESVVALAAADPLAGATVLYHIRIPLSFARRCVSLALPSSLCVSPLTAPRFQVQPVSSLRSLAVRPCPSVCRSSSAAAARRELAWLCMSSCVCSPRRPARAGGGVTRRRRHAVCSAATASRGGPLHEPVATSPDPLCCVCGNRDRSLAGRAERRSVRAEMSSDGVCRAAPAPSGTRRRPGSSGRRGAAVHVHRSAPCNRWCRAVTRPSAAIPRSWRRNDDVRAVVHSSATKRSRLAGAGWWAGDRRVVVRLQHGGHGDGSARSSSRQRAAADLAATTTTTTTHQ